MIYSRGEQATIDKILDGGEIPVGYFIENKTEIRWMRVEEVCLILIQQSQNQNAQQNQNVPTQS